MTGESARVRFRGGFSATNDGMLLLDTKSANDESLLPSNLLVTSGNTERCTENRQPHKILHVILSCLT